MRKRQSEDYEDEGENRKRSKDSDGFGPLLARISTMNSVGLVEIHLEDSDFRLAQRRKHAYLVELA